MKKNALTQVENLQNALKLKCDSSEFLVFSSVSFSGGDLVDQISARHEEQFDHILQTLCFYVERQI